MIMNQERRKFIKKGSLAVAAAMAMPYAFSDAKKSAIGVQLYTVRDAMSQDPRGTMKKVADIGYKQVETAGYKDRKFYGFEPGEFLNITKDLGLDVVSSHVNINAIKDNLDQILEDMVATEQKYLVVPWVGDDYRSADGFKVLADLLNQKGEQCKRAGIMITYHNHDFEFKDLNGTTGMDILLNVTDRDFVNFESDLYWVKKAGLDPVKFVTKYPGRFPLWHVKDMDNTEKGYFTEVGNGIINYNEVFKNADTAGMKHFFVEQDRSDNPLKSIEISYKGVKKIL